MANTNRNETVTFTTAVDDAALQGLADSINGLGKTAEGVTPEITALFDNLDALNTTASDIKGFLSQTAALADVGNQLTLAINGLDELSAAYDRTDTSSAKINAAFAKADATIASLTARQAELQIQLQYSSGALDKAGIDTDNLAVSSAELGDSIQATSARLAGLVEAASAAAEAQEVDAVSVESLAEKYGLLGSVVENIKSLFATIGAFIALEKADEEIKDILSTGDKFTQWGIEFANAFGGAEKGQEALAQVKELAEKVPLSLDNVVQAALEAKKVGLDPLDGSLQTLIDTNAKYGGSIDSLNTLIDDFGKASAKGELSTKLLITLQQSGVPAAQLLGAAMGKTADQINDLAKKGDLGRDSIALLLKQLATSASGDAAKSMGLLGTLALKVKDNWDEFLELIASSGVYDFVRDKLNAINVALKQGLGDGSLKDKAKAISDGLVAIGNAAVGAFKFVSDHATAIYETGKAYVILRTAMLGVDLVGMASKFATSTIAAAENAAATQANAAAQTEAAEATAAHAKTKLELAEAMQAAGIATAEQTALLEANAAASSGVVSAAYTKLGTVIEGLRAQLNNLSTAAKAGISAVAIYEVYEGALKLNEALKTYQELQAINNAADKDRIETQTALSAKAAQVAVQFKAAADVQIKSASELKALNQQQSAAYLQSLQDAIRYYTALKVQAQAVGDSEGIGKASAELKELGLAAIAATAQAAPLTQEVNKVSDATKTLVNQILEFRTEGVAAAVAVEGAFTDLKLQTAGGFKGLTDSLTLVKNLSGDTASAIKSELVQSLLKLNDLDFEAFRKNLNGALAEGKIDADALRIALGAELQAELEKLGVSAQDAGDKFTATGQKIIGAFASIATNSLASANQIQTAFVHALDSSKTQAEVDALTAQLTAAFNAGKLSAAQYAQALQSVKLATDAIQESSQKAALALTPYQQALQKLGVTSQESLNEIAKSAKQNFQIVIDSSDGSAASLANNKTAFLSMAQAQLAAAASSDEATKQQVANSLLQQSYTYQDSDAVQALIDKYLHLGVVIAGLGGGSGGVSGVTSQVKTLNNEFQAGEDHIKSFSTSFSGLSQAAIDAYQNAQKAAITLVTGMTAFAAEYAQIQDEANRRTNASILDQQNGVKNLTDLYNGFATSANNADGQTAETLQRRADAMAQFSQQLKNGTSDFNYLDQSSLSALEASVDAAKSKVQQLADAAKAAAQQFADLAQQTQDALDQASGNQTAIEDRRHATALANLQAEAKAAGELNSATYQQAVANENALFQLNLKNIKSTSDAQTAANTKNAQQQTTAATQASQAATAASGGAGSVTGAIPTGLSVINIHLDGQPQAQFYGDATNANLLADLLKAKNNSI